MKGNWLLQKGIFRFLILNLLIAIAYAIGVNLSVQFMTLTGGVASVWFPSGMTLALVFSLGKRVFLGIAIGSFLGNWPSLLNYKPELSLFNILLIHFACICGNILQPWLAAYFIKKFAQHKDIFSHVDTVVLYIIAAFFSPTISASFGVTSLYFAELIKSNEYVVSWVTWWLHSALAHLIFTPALLLYKESRQNCREYKLWNDIIIIFILVLISWFVFVKSYPLEYLFLPILIWIVFRFGRFISSLSVSLISLVAIVSTSRGYGIFVAASANESLILLQSFTSVLAVTSLILSAVIDERTEAQLLLMQFIENLESQVIERTAKLRQSETSLKQANLELKKLVNLDGLTQIANRRCFNDRIKFEWERLSREQQPLSLLLFDIDYFKRYNDCYGHQFGDECLKSIAQALEQTLGRPADLLARYGGEEFVAILPNTEINGAIMVAEEMRRAIANLEIPHQNSDISNVVTVSVGITSLIPNLQEKSSTLIKQADIALYDAKQKGRNRAIVFDE